MNFNMELHKKNKLYCPIKNGRNRVGMQYSNRKKTNLRAIYKTLHFYIVGLKNETVSRNVVQQENIRWTCVTLPGGSILETCQRLISLPFFANTVSSDIQTTTTTKQLSYGETDRGSGSGFFLENNLKIVVVFTEAGKIRYIRRFAWEAACWLAPMKSPQKV